MTDQVYQLLQWPPVHKQQQKEPENGSQTLEIELELRSNRSNSDEASNAESASSAPSPSLASAFGKSPTDSSSFFGRVAYYWLTPLLQRGALAPLTVEDVMKFPLPADSEIRANCDRLEAAWNDYQLRAKVFGDHPKWLMYALLRTFGRAYAWTAMPMLIDMALHILRPLALSELLQSLYVLDGSDPPDSLAWQASFFPSVLGYAVFLVSFLLVSAAVRGFASFYERYANWKLSMEVKTSLSSLVFRKTLRLPTVRRGMAANLLNVDPYKVSEVVWYLLRAFGYSVLILLIVLMLGRWLGIAALTPVVLILLVGPFSAYLWKQFAEAELNIMLIKDKRIKALSEILHAILVVKLMNWEERMKAKVNGIRRKELSFVRQLLMAEAGSQVVSLSLILFTSVLMFLIYLLLGNEMTANVVFPSLIYVYELNWPLLSLADTFRAFSDAWNSSQRIYHFLNKEEIHENKLLMTGSNEADTPREMYNHRTPTESKDDKQMEDEDEEETEEEVIVLKDACFEWYEEGDECEDEDEQDKEQSQKRKNGTEDEDDSEDDEMEEEGKQDRKKRLRIGGQKADPLLSAADATIISPSTAASFPSAGSEPASLTVSTVDSCRSPCISNLNFCVRRGELVMVIGRVGAFKSALLKGILGELKLISGQRLVSGKVGYVPQSAWIRSDTVEQNIKFAYPDEEDEFYKQVLSVCCLSDDLRMFPQGDQTKIGEKGITVSGGQRQRCSLARAVYSRPDILLLDDVLSAVDAHVGKAIFHNCLMGPLLAGTTRVLVTHALQYLPYADRIVVMNAGKIVQMGTFEEMSTQGVDFSEWLKTAEEKQNEKEQQEQVEPLDNNSNQQTFTSAANSPEILLHSCSLSALPIHQSSLTLTASNAESEPVNSAPSCRVESKFAIQLSTSVVESSAHKPVQPRQDETAVDTGTGIVEEEERETGAVSLKVYWTYFKSVGSPWFLVLLVLISIGQECSYQLSSVWLAEWTSAAAAGVLADNSTSTNATNLNSSVRHASVSWVSPSASLDGGSTRFYLVVYLGLAVANLLCLFSRQFTWFNGVLNASFRFHDSLLHAILYARMSFFYSTPTGRVTNRFSKDISSVDQHLPNCINAAWMCLLAICAVAILVSSLLPIMIPVLLVVFYAYFKVYQFYKCSVRELGRLESLTASPIFAHYGEVIEGLDSVRAFRAQDFLQGESEAFLQRNANVFFLLGAAHSWLGVRVELLASMVLFAISCLAIISSSFLPPAFLGLLLTSTELCTADLSWFVRMAAVVESTMNSVERLNHFIETPAEESAEQAAQRPPPLWPSRGEIVFDKVSMRYRPGLPLVIKGVDMKIAAREKIGIVGKTGAGKSSLTALLFRLVDIEAESKILIDGVDIRQVSLSSLRQCLAVINQDPILFSGTIRSNLDPFHQHLDSQIWTALASVSLADKVRAYPKQLRTAVADNGKNFSVGERQLFCMARAMLRQDAKVVVLDEASSNVDQISDSLIQNTLRQAFDDRTVLIIAHRLHTIIHCDRVLVMHAGSAVEFDSPANLLRKEGGKFRALVEELGEASAAVLKKEAEEAENKKAVV